MRLPLKGDDYFVREVNVAFEKIRGAYLKALKPHIMMKKMNVMLGDGSVVQSDTFEKHKVILFYQQLIKSLNGWVQQASPTRIQMTCIVCTVI